MSTVGACCACWLYSWNKTETRTQINALDAANVTEIYIWRGDAAPVTGTVGGAPQWFMDEMSRFLARGGRRPELKTDDDGTHSWAAR
jgi:hypothetical protein